MINASNLQSEVSRRLPKMLPGERLSIRTWKNDRGITLVAPTTAFFRSPRTVFLTP